MKYYEVAGYGANSQMIRLGFTVLEKVNSKLDELLNLIKENYRFYHIKLVYDPITAY